MSAALLPVAIQKTAPSQTNTVASIFSVLLSLELKPYVCDPGGAGAGTACTVADECQSGYCSVADGTGLCSSVCVSDSDCVDGTTCELTNVGTDYIAETTMCVVSAMPTSATRCGADEYVSGNACRHALLARQTRQATTTPVRTPNVTMSTNAQRQMEAAPPTRPAPMQRSRATHPAAYATKAFLATGWAAQR